MPKVNNPDQFLLIFPQKIPYQMQFNDEFAQLRFINVSRNFHMGLFTPPFGYTFTCLLKVFSEYISPLLWQISYIPEKWFLLSF